MKKFTLKLLGAILVGLAVGLLSVGWAIEKVVDAQSERIGPWRTNPNIGSEDADPYTKAYVALHGLLALNRTEAIYFTAVQDSSGELLSGRCSYVVKGSAIDTRWWTITAYGSDDYLIANAQGRYSISVHDVGEEDFSFMVAKHAPSSGGFLPHGGVKRFSLTLRAYNPSPALMNQLDTIELPTITKGACDG
jgi:hypothetical protein